MSDSRWEGDGGEGTGGDARHVGRRATVRYLRWPTPPPGEPALTDAVGEVRANNPDEIVLATRRGEVRIPRDRVVATRLIPPARGRRAALPGGALSPLQMAAAGGSAWPAPEVEHLGEWLLRAGGGFSARANSVLPVGDPGLPLPAALDRVEAWYAARGLPPNLTIAVPLHANPLADPLAALALTRGYVASEPTLFLTASTDAVRAGCGGPPPVGLEVTTRTDLTDVWLAAYDGYRTADRAALTAILDGSPLQSLATAVADGRVVGVGRLGGDQSWAGIAAMYVDPAYRRRSVARALLVALSADAQRSGVPGLHLQVWADNVAALALYEGCGFVRHHHYVNVARSEERAAASPAPAAT